MKNGVKEENGQLISASLDQRIIIWNKHNIIHNVHEGNDGYTSLLELKKHRGYIVAGKYNGEIELFDTKTIEIKLSFTAHTKYVSVLYELDSGQLITGSTDKNMKLWDLEREEHFVREFDQHYLWVNCVIQHSSGVVISGSDDMRACVWDPTNGKLLRIVEHEETIEQFQELSAWKVLSICFKYPIANFSMKIWDLLNGATIYNVPVPQIEPYGFYSSYLVNQELVILGGGRGNLVIFNLERKQFILDYQLHKKPITQICKLNENQIMTSSIDKNIKISN